jgi:hypothetical protein
LRTRQAKLLKKFTGGLTAEIQTSPEALLTVDKVLQAAGKTVKGAKGGSLKVISVVKNKNGDYEIKFKLEKPPSVAVDFNPWIFGGAMRLGAIGGPINMRIQINGNVVIANGVTPTCGVGPSLSLLDGKGNQFVLAGTSGRADLESSEMTLTFRPGKGNIGAPEKFIYTAPRKVTVDVPFAFKDVKLP